MLEVRVDTSRFNSTFAEFTQFNKRNPVDLANKNAYEVAKIATKTTKFVPKEAIRASLNAPSRVSPSMRICEVLANKIRVSKGEKALVRNKLKVAGNKYVTKKASSSKFLIAGNIPAIKALAPLVKVKSSYGVTAYAAGRPKGGAKSATGDWNAKSAIWNSVLGGYKKWAGAPGRNIAKVQRIIRDGYQAALNTKEADMRVYIDRKMNEAIQKFNRS